MIKAVMILGLAAFACAQQGYQQGYQHGYQQQQQYNARTNIPVRQVAILRQANENNADGSFGFSYETEDGQTAEARGQLQADGAEGAQATQGSYGYTGPDGQRYTVSYSAGANGFEAQGAHLPVAPAIPEAIAKALADNAADEARGVYDDGSYREEGVQGQGQVRTVGVTQTTYQHGASLQQVQQGYQQGYQQVQQAGYQQVRGYQIPSGQLRF